MFRVFCVSMPSVLTRTPTKHACLLFLPEHLPRNTTPSKEPSSKCRFAREIILGVDLHKLEQFTCYMLEFIQ